MKLGKRLGRAILVLAFWLGLWMMLARLVDTALLLPGPWAVAKRLAELAVTLGFWRTTAVSLLRVLLGVALGVITGVLLAALMSRFRLLRALFSPLLTIVRATPVASVILLALIWLGRDFLPCFIVWLMVLPVVWANVSAGIEAVDKSLLEVARLYRFSWGRKLRRIYVPSVMPYFLSALRTGMGLAWKAGVAAEVLTVPVKSIGRYLYESKLYLETTDLFAWTVVVVLCSLGLEKLMLAAIGRLDKRWNRGGQA
ncbi:MAG: ABC transporter permease subunit [Oscillospiraceae bacterium]|nr:ABC transporter permease subunit [Oscillospiraceae bacterium]